MNNYLTTNLNNYITYELLFAKMYLILVCDDLSSLNLNFKIH